MARPFLRFKQIFEWCWDWYGSGYYSVSPGTDPKGPGSGPYRVLRGGSWMYLVPHSTCAYRGGYFGVPAVASSVVGFRCVRGS